jgi:hypothetical protein
MKWEKAQEGLKARPFVVLVTRAWGSNDDVFLHTLYYSSSMKIALRIMTTLVIKKILELKTFIASQPLRRFFVLLLHHHHLLFVSCCIKAPNGTSFNIISRCWGISSVITLLFVNPKGYIRTQGHGYS